MRTETGDMSQGYYRFPTICGDRVAFTCEDDLWVVPREGGVARRLTSNLGAVGRGAYSPDGKMLAFTGSEDGPPEVFLVHELSHRRHVGRPLYGGKGGIDTGEQVDVPDLEATDRQQEDDGQRARASARVAEDHCPAAVPPVDERAGQRGEHNARQHSGKPDQSKLCRRSRPLKDPHAERKSRQPRTDQGDDLPQPNDDERKHPV